MNMTKNIGVSIVNYRTPGLLLQCLSSLNQERIHLPNLKVIIVDNQSRDDSVERISRFITDNDFSSWVKLITAKRNGGFSYGNNIAFRELEGFDYIWMLNPDTRLRERAGINLVEFLEANPAAGVAGSRLEDEDGTSQISTFNFPSPFGELIEASKLGIVANRFSKRVIPRAISNNNESVNWIAGASMMLRREVINKVGLMDEGYFLYYEEVDYCFDIIRAGFEIWYVPGSRVIHEVGAATGISDLRKKKPRRPAYWFASRRRFFAKKYGMSGAITADLMWLLGYLIYMLKRLIQRKPNVDPPFFLWDFVRNSSLICGTRVS